MSECNDVELVDRFIAGDSAAFDALHQRYHRRVCAWLRRRGLIDADTMDVAQDVFVRVFRAMGQFDSGRGTFVTWLGTIARNCASRHIARHGRERDLDRPEAWATRTEQPTPDELAARTEQRDAVADCTGRLPSELRRIIRLRYARSDTTRTIAATVGISEGSVRNRLAEAKDLLEQCLKGKGIL